MWAILAPPSKKCLYYNIVKCAIRFMRKHAEEYGIDPNRVAVWGIPLVLEAPLSKRFEAQTGLADILLYFIQ
ncbi:hypothetical protein [Paenibacillus sonchi]|uniref:hypothetical protein n=1 Tax=Paenibacillus sonchi TaxID=373687 RepID=UPI00398BA481